MIENYIFQEENMQSFWDHYSLWNDPDRIIPLPTVIKVYFGISRESFRRIHQPKMKLVLITKKTLGIRLGELKKYLRGLKTYHPEKPSPDEIRKKIIKSIDREKITDRIARNLAKKKEQSKGK